MIKKEAPVWEKSNLTLEEAAAYSGIGIHNIKVIQDVLGHKDISTTMDIYVDVTKELKKKEFDNLGDFFG